MPRLTRCLSVPILLREQIEFPEIAIRTLVFEYRPFFGILGVRLKINFYFSQALMVFTLTPKLSCKHPFRDGSTHVALAPLDRNQRLNRY